MPHEYWPLIQLGQSASGPPDAGVVHQNAGIRVATHGVLCSYRCMRERAALSLEHEGASERQNCSPAAAPRNARVLAANSLLDRGFGPPARTEVTGEIGTAALRIEFVALTQHTGREALECNAPRVIEAIELEPQHSDSK